MIKVIGMIILTAFYGVYFGKMAAQHKKGIRTDQMAKGKKPLVLYRAHPETGNLSGGVGGNIQPNPGFSCTFEPFGSCRDRICRVRRNYFYSLRSSHEG